METTINHDVTEFYGKLLHCEANSGKMRWNAICEDIISIYENKFEEKERMINSRDLWKLLFEPEVSRERNKVNLCKWFTTNSYRDFFMNTIYIALDDPKGWSEWTSHYKY